MVRRFHLFLAVGFFAALIASPLVVKGLATPAFAAAAYDSVAAPGAADPTAKGPRAVSLITLTYQYGNSTKNISVFFPSSGAASPVAIILPVGEPQVSDPMYQFGQAQHLASWGWVVAVPGAMWSEDPVEQRNNVPYVSKVLDTVLGASQLAGKMTDRAAIVGPQFNGVTARMAAAADSRFKAVISMHAATFGPGQLGPDTAAPYMAMGGVAENGFPLCAIANTWSETYRTSRATHRAMYKINAAHPIDFQEPPGEDTLGFCGGARATPFAWIKGLMTAWLEYYVKGDATQFDNLYQTGGDSTLPNEVSESAAANAPLAFKAVMSSTFDVHLSWQAWITDTTVLDGLLLERTSSSGEAKTLGKLPLDSTSFDDSIASDTVYTYTLRYADKNHHLFQPATARAGSGFPTPTATPTPRPTATATVPVTPTATRTPTPGRTPPTPTAAATRFVIRLPWAAKVFGP